MIKSIATANPWKSWMGAVGLLLAADGVMAEAKSVSAANPERKLTMTSKADVSSRQMAIVPIAAATAVGDMPKLNEVLNAGLDAGLSVSETREILVQLYAYAGFPRSLNALAELMNILQAREQRGIQDNPGREARPVPSAEAMLEAGTANQTQLVGAPVKGPLFEFAPVIDQYLKAHLFGDIFERDNLDWQSRELATVGALAALSGVESQLDSHIRISLNVGLSPEQLSQAVQALRDQQQNDAAQRLAAALERQRAKG